MKLLIDSFAKRKTIVMLLFLVIISIPTFSKMLRPGIFSMQDFHYFRLVEFDKCIRNLRIPCRWAPDSGAGYGEPLFNFYGQFPYAVGEIFHLVSFSKIDSLKIIFILSLVLSAVGMFFLGKKVWKSNLSALVSTVLYLYAPYRAVDVWVRGALPEAFGFVFFPLIILSFENYLEKRKIRDLLFFSLSISLLIVTHNLSLILFAPFFVIWGVFRFWQIRKIKLFIELGVAAIFSVLISSFYILPVIFESKFITIDSTTVGYFDWRAHFVTLYQLFVSKFWGYGASVWGPNDGLSLSVGYMQWIVPALISVLIAMKFLRTHKFSILNFQFLILVLIGMFCLFLTHNQSTFIWKYLSFMKYIQFPWRFLGVSDFAFALSGGFIALLLSKRSIKIALIIIICLITFGLNFSFYRPDIWYSVSDRYFDTGAKWDEARFASIGDYWPNFGHKIPNKISDGKYINYFPGWNCSEGQSLKFCVKDGLIPAEGAKFNDTPIRTIGNIISLMSIGVWIILFVKFRYGNNFEK